MTAALLSRPTARRSRRTSDSTFVNIEGAVFEASASTGFKRERIGGCDNERDAKKLVARLRAAEFARAALRSHDSYMTARFGDPSSSTLTDTHAAANWRRVRAALDAYKRIDAP